MSKLISWLESQSNTLHFETPRRQNAKVGAELSEKEKCCEHRKFSVCLLGLDGGAKLFALSASCSSVLDED